MGEHQLIPNIPERVDREEEPVKKSNTARMWNMK